MEHMHSIHPSVFLNNKVMLWTLIDRWYQMSRQIVSEDKDISNGMDIDWDDLKDKIAIVKRICKWDELKDRWTDRSIHETHKQLAFEFMFECVFCHNDLLGGNILYLQNEHCVKFVDFEYGHYNFRAFEFANHFCEYCGFDCNWKQGFPSQYHMRDFLTCYVKEYVKPIAVDTSHSNTASDIQLRKNEALVSKLKRLHEQRSQSTENGKKWDCFIQTCVDIVLCFACADHVYWGLWGVVQAKHSKIDFDFKKYAKDRLLHGLQFALSKVSL
ncbi:choline/ethanolamine kinase [Reticulomyxa filosa]|uniref:ethanolamine kinase n=1 Tax=Reticulomyxa filosa TaxID=46433 RepID=X6P346_RETFI|nr:choline/ethanolamine kinase [Reticulomyxa filosa]|eukprot:ETO32553.1 choline/ethanolamine kinase [Reticulomyxa filosa]